MTLTELLTLARQDLLDDSVTPYLWTDTQLTRFANEAIREACKRTPLYTRTYTFAVTVGKRDYALNAAVKQITYVKLANQASPLFMVTDAELAYHRPNWRNETGEPGFYARKGNTLMLHPIPIRADVMTLEASLIPDDDFDLDEHFPAEYAESLAYWIAYKAYMIQDADRFNPVKAAEYRAIFDQMFGTGHSAKYDNVANSTPMYGTILPVRMC